MLHDHELEQRRCEIEEHSREFHEALVKLRAATKRPLGLADKIREEPLACVLGSLLFGLWLGSRHD